MSSSTPHHHDDNDRHPPSFLPFQSPVPPFANVFFATMTDNNGITVSYMFLCCPNTTVPPSPPNSAPLPFPRRRECKFCRTNGEAIATYTSHTLRCPYSNKLVCPVLRAHTCEVCGATGDDAHTRNYCPKLSLDKKMRQALPSQLTATRRKANGIRK